MNQEYFDKILPPSGKGRPRVILNDKGKAFVTMLSKYMVTEEEIAAEMDVTVETLHNRWNKDIFLECKKKGQQKGKVSLRRYQFKLAEKNASMSIFLGKQYLGQKDEPINQDGAITESNRRMLTFADLLNHPAQSRDLSELEGQSGG